ncbi:MAG: hypothetical protein A3J65_03210 [Candidatus Buchananbacteria bacterium RIFCSPHIGHO2_02_FULL_45_11b]|uniref:DOT1 domain-containing protein n=4 Tax=Candidatus Buchananiibacteriota TaxID=1817903 RepID=A0A1G1YC29_9BACT|nr:MAG: hypothetical protein A2663_04940 [Candidatus Buchananbacteria bacterium RIFCSPHIGHO2_01_FULL_46_12]OGY49898.1 MAG: hypothetical protein A3J65_03210 [Candidatus Buchananbacteria bacterium RIFCSPHIGHO2_02_FULL_45_11b]OGY54015.1 MAG: hypothetical protein A3B15_01650 [Candidatus Buchananbacteria bacterium RIFCSPLOWO2_01_FULL_45_31]OGY57574.1 MAG: hypothetical protein A3H67_00810 [Candidatus Buchananbacteria bacterium RIFCSPLOWO2_02_FULL_46_11b]
MGGVLAAPWVPLWQKDVKRMLKLAQIGPDETVYDLGAGDGRILLIAAKNFGAKAVGFEIAILPYLLGWVKILLSGQRGKAKLYCRNFFKADLSQADVICAFLTPRAMLKLKPKLEKEAKPGCRVISYAFKIPGWEPVLADKPDQKTAAVYVYRR